MSSSFSISNLLANNDQSKSPILEESSKKNCNEESIIEKSSLSNTMVQNLNETEQSRFLMKLFSAQFAFYQNIVLKNRESESTESPIIANNKKTSSILEINTSK
jgi:hypothetical protein